MKVIEVKHPIQSDQIIQGPIVMVLGFFDGIHRGHQQVIQQAKEVSKKKNLPLVLMTFNHHPFVYYHGMTQGEFEYLSTLARKKELLQHLGVDFLYIIDFDQGFSSLSPQEFVDQYLVALNVDTAVAGFDYTYGKKDIANMKTLPIHAKNRFDVVAVKQISHNNHKISSTYIRDFIQQGQVKAANKELGYLYQNQGLVIHGKKRGRRIGFPTANLQMEEGALLPGIGVYIVEMMVQNKWYRGMASIGHNLTFNSSQEIFVEVYLLNFSTEIYGELVKVRWLEYIRPEMKFAGVDELVQQLKDDEIQTKNFSKDDYIKLIPHAEW